jgi:DNA-binding NarL/FixJ family response regulator
MRVLIADDSLLLRTQLHHLLSEVPGVEEISEAEDVAAAIRLCSSFTPDALILDLQMPGGSGFDVLHALRQQGADCTIFVLTNHADDCNRRKCKALGAQYFFDKTREYEDALAVIEREAAKRASFTSGYSR